MNQPTRQEESTGRTSVLYLAFELGSTEWKLAFASQRGEKPRLRSIAAGNLAGLQAEIVWARQRFKISGDQVASCYEAGRDGFWLHRALVGLGIDNVVVDSSSIEVNRRGRRAKTDRLDAEKLLSLRIRWSEGERKVWSVVRVPTPEQEDARQLSRELEELKHERTSHRNRIQSLLVSQGVKVKLGPEFLLQLEKVVLWDGSALGSGLKERIQREYERLVYVQEQIQGLEKHRQQAIAVRTSEPDLELIHRLSLLKGIGLTSAWVFVQEFFSWRRFRNRREVAALAGLAPVPYKSGERLDRELGISKAGNWRVRSLAVEIAWSWLRWQPQSQLSLWFRERYGPGSRRSRKVGIVALARKLLIELWRYLQTGVAPEGAILKTV